MVEVKLSFIYEFSPEEILDALNRASDEGKKWVLASDVARILLPIVKRYVRENLGEEYSKEITLHGLSISVGVNLNNLAKEGKILRKKETRFSNSFYKPLT